MIRKGNSGVQKDLRVKIMGKWDGFPSTEEIVKFPNTIVTMKLQVNFK